MPAVFPRRLPGQLTIVLLLVALVATLGSSTLSPASAGSLSEMEGDLQEVNERISQLEGELDGADEELEVASARLEQLRVEREAAVDELEVLESQFAIAEREVLQADEAATFALQEMLFAALRLERTRAELHGEQQVLASQSLQAYKQGSLPAAPSMLDGLVSGEQTDPHELSRSLSYFRSAMEFQSGVIERVEQLQVEAADQAAEVEELAAERNRQLAAAEDARDQAGELRDEAQRVATRLAAQEAETEQLLAQLEAEQREQQDELSELRSRRGDLNSEIEAERARQEAARQAAAQQNQGSSPNPPVSGAVAGSMCPFGGSIWHMDDWHFPRAGGRVHMGNDVFADEGTPIYSPVNGRVDWLQNVDRGTAGLGIAVMGDNGWRWVFVHNQRPVPGLQQGQRVSVGDLIGYVGKTGNARTTPPHAHTELRPGPFGTPRVNPYPYVRELCS